MGTIDLIICGFYLIMTIVIGGLVGKKQHSTEEYFLAGRGMSWWPIAISLFASLFSAISYIAMPGEAYNFGCTMLVSGLVGVVALPVTLLVFLRFFYMLKLWTINEYVERRFSVSLRVVNSLIFMLGRLVYLGVVLYATALLLENALGWNPVIAVLAVGIFSTIYTYMGGMEAVVWTDVVQFFVLLGGVLLVIGVISWYTPGRCTGDLGDRGGAWPHLSTRSRFGFLGFFIQAADFTSGAASGAAVRGADGDRSGQSATLSCL